MITTAQARRAGVSAVDLNRLVHDGILEPAPGAARVYRLTGAPEDLDLDALRAAWLQLGDALWWHERMRTIDAVVSHRSAARLRELGDLIPTEHELYVDRRRQIRRHDLRLRARRDLAQIPWEAVDGLPCTTVTRLIDDLLTDREDESAIAQICHDALRDGHLTPEQLQPITARHARHYGRASGAELAAALTITRTETTHP